MELSPRKILETPFFSLEELGPKPTGQFPYYRLTGPNSAIVLLFNDDAEILVVRQFRPSLDEMTMELPAGAIEPGEDPKAAAEREVLEETGCKSALFQLGGYFHLMMNRTNIKDYLFCGLAEEQEPALAEVGVDHEWLTREGFRSAAFDGSYRQLAGLGILQLASQQMGIDVLTAPAPTLLERLREELVKNDRR